MPTAISTDVGSIFVRAPAVTVKTAVSLAGPWTTRPNLYVDRIREAVSPSISEVSLKYYYGEVMHPGATSFATVAPLEIEGLWVWVSVGSSTGLRSLGNWNASTNSPTITSGSGTAGDYYDVTTAGTTTIDGVSEWEVRDVIRFNGTAWVRDKAIEDWYGKIVIDSRSPMGIAETGGATAGVQNFTAYDLKKVCEDYTVKTAKIEGQTISGTTAGNWNASTNSPTLTSSTGTAGTWYTVNVAGSTTLDGISSWAVGDRIKFDGDVWLKFPATIEINKGLSFNADERGEFSGFGNRSTNTYAITGNNEPASYVFSYAERDAEQWTAEQAVNYLLTHIGPKVLPSVNWALDVSSGNLSWNPRGNVPTDRVTFKALLDTLISRHRGVGWRLKFTPDATKPTITVVVFSYSDSAITMPDGTTFDANPNQYSLDFEQSFDIASCNVSNKKTSQFHRVVVEGAWRTSTCSLRVDKTHNELIADWTEDDANAYATAASAESWYAALNREDKNRANATSRSSDKFAAVYRRFRISDEWDLFAADASATALSYRVFPAIDVTDDDSFASPAANDSTWIAGLTVEDRLTLRERYDYSGSHIPDGDWTTTATVTTEPPFLSPFCFMITNVPKTDDWELLDKIDGDVEAKPGKRKWSINTKAHHDRAAVTLDVSGGPQHFFAATDFFATTPYPAVFDAKDDPSPNKNYGLDWFNSWVTLTLQSTERVRIEKVISSPATGEQERILTIPAHDCRLDYVVPHTVVGVVNGSLQQTDGGFVRDDRKRLHNFATAAALWYGKERQTIDITFRQVRNLVTLGDLITDVGPTYSKTGVNSVVSAITYDLLSLTTSFETSYSEFDTV